MNNPTEGWERERNIYAGKYADERDENTRLRAEIARYTAFVAAFDAWVNNKPGDLPSGGMTDLFHEMLRLRAALPAAADPATEGS